MIASQAGGPWRRFERDLEYALLVNSSVAHQATGDRRQSLPIALGGAIEALPPVKTSQQGLHASRGITVLLKSALFLYVCFLFSPIRHWPLEDGTDPTWRFALNWAPAHGYAIGRDYVYCCGPLEFLSFPQHVGGNLGYGLIFQICLWAILIAILSDLFFRSGFNGRNLALFSFCMGLACPLFWVESLGTEYQMLAGALLLLAGFQKRGGWIRYAGALLFIGLLPLFKITAGIIGFGALAGFLVERTIERGKKVWGEALLALVPVAIACGICLVSAHSGSALLAFLRGSAEIVRGYSAAMSLSGSSHVEFLEAVEAGVVVAAALWLQATTDHRLARFYALLLGAPFLISLKHGFVRESVQMTNYFCFVALALALISLTIIATKATARRFLLVLAGFTLIWQETALRLNGKVALAESSGLRSARMVWGAARFGQLPQRLDSSLKTFPEASRIEPELISRIGDSPVASLSFAFTNLAAAGLQLTLYPTVQRFEAYTPSLDRRNAQWIRDKGPRFLVFDGKAVDDRDAWAETPAMWLEIYRWYDTRFLGTRNLLLERREMPRFGDLEEIGKSQIGLSGALEIPSSSDAVFWTMKCGYSVSGSLRKLVARVPPVTMTVHETGGEARPARRIIPEVLVSPVLGNYLPGNLAQFAKLFESGTNPGYSVNRIEFGGDGASAYTSACEVEFLRTATPESGSRAFLW
jgi:hypothetical protein